MIMAPAAQQIANLFSMLFMLTSLGIPLSMPPGPEDPFLAQIAPEQCIYYSRWAGIASPDPDSKNQIDQLFKDPEIQRFLAELSLRARHTQDFIRRQGNGADAVFAEVSITLGKLVLTQPTVIFVSDVTAAPPSMDGGVVVKLGDQLKEVEQALKQLQQSIPAEVITQRDIDGVRFSQANVPTGTTLTWGIRDGYLMLGIGDDAIRQIIDRSRTPAPDWLRQLEAENQLPRRATLTYADLSAITNLAMQTIDDSDLDSVAQATGLLDLKSYVAITGLDESRFVSRTRFETDGKPTGLLSAVKGRPLTADDLAKVPDDALIALLANVDLNHLLDVVMAFLDETSPASAAQLEDTLDQVQRQMGVNLTKDVLGSLGECWRIYASPREGGLVTGWVASVDVEDVEALKKAQDNLLGMFKNIPNAPFAIQSVELNGTTVHTISLSAGYPIAPSWNINGDDFVIGLLPQAVRAHVAGVDQEKSLSQIPEVRQRLQLNNPPKAMAYMDTPRLLEIAYPAVQVTMQVYGGILRGEGLANLDVSMLPSTTALCRHARPSVITAHTIDHGIVLESHHSLPAGSFGAVAPLVTASLLPAMHSARIAAERSQSINHLKQIMLATLNHESAYGSYPAAYNTDENGKPLLSWRVHILPFIEEQQLYQDFRLDEPWNSPHNRKLIPLMPNIYRAPGSEADPGKTVYVAVRDERGVIVAPEGQDGIRNPRGMRMRKIKDGTSKTIVLLEASDDLAVIWTKPDDFVPAEDDPINGVVGLRKEGFLAAYGDGSIRIIPKSIQKDTLKALFTRDGGEPTRGF